MGDQNMISTKIKTTLVAGILLFGLSSFAAPKHRENHRKIHRAMMILNRAKRVLQHAAHDFKGHRVAAIHDIEQAQGELRQAWQADRH